MRSAEVLALRIVPLGPAQGVHKAGGEACAVAPQQIVQYYVVSGQDVSNKRADPVSARYCIPLMSGDYGAWSGGLVPPE